MSTIPDLELAAVSKRYGAFSAVNELSFSIAPGSFFSILGPSGCGKTTLLRMIAGFIEPDAGEIRIRGQAMHGVAPNRRPATMVFQHLALFPMMSVGENIAYGLKRRGAKAAEIRSKVGAMLERVGLPGSEHKPISALSGGQKQRVAIARSLVLEPTLLLLDEPLGALDLKLREHMKIELKQLQHAIGTTFIYITHDQSEALVLSDTVAVMNQGRFEQFGTPQSLYYQPASAFVAGFVGANNRYAARVVAQRGELAECVTDSGLALIGRIVGAAPRPGDAVELFVRPETVSLAREAADLAHCDLVIDAEVDSLLFDGANSSVLLVDKASRTPLRAALPQNGRFANLAPGEPVQLGLQVNQIWGYPAR